MAKPHIKKDNNIIHNIMARLLLLSYRIPDTILLSLQNAFFHKWKRIPIRRIIILRQGGLGDSVSSYQAILTIREQFPNAILDLLTHEKLDKRTSIEDIFPTNTFDNIFRYQSFPDPQLADLLKNNNYDLYIELPSYLASFTFELRSILFAKKIKTKAAFGWQVGSNSFLKKWQERLFHFERDAERQLDILKRNGLLINNTANTENKKQEGTANLSPYSIPKNVLKIALIIGAGRPQNQWPIEYFQYVAHHYTGLGYCILLIGGAKESGIADHYFQASGVIDLCGKLSPLQDIDILQQCSLAISNDTGPMHLAWLAGTPLIAIFSGRDYSNKWYPPLSRQNIVLRNDKVPCFTCFSNTCMDNICMKSISAEEVIQKADELLGLLKV